MNCSQCGNEYGLEEKLALARKEIEDLKAKVKSLEPRATLYSMTEFFKECEKPEFRNGLYEKEIESLKSERDHYKAALEKIGKIADTSGYVPEIEVIVAQTLHVVQQLDIEKEKP